MSVPVHTSPTRYLPVFCMVLLTLTSCGNRSESTGALGRAYIGALKAPLYAELAADPGVNAELNFGTEVTLLRQRRSFYYVRGSSGEEGWTHRSALFNERQVAEVRALARYAGEAPQQGEARVFATLNVHNHPNRLAPTIFRIDEGQRVAVILHERHPRSSYDPGPLLGGSAGPETGGQSEQESGIERNEVEMPPPPAPPPLPPTWAQMSGISASRIATLREDGLLDSVPGRLRHATGDLWTLVRNADGLAGWALNARLVPAIPDRVAQYSEGARITAYFALQAANQQEDAYHWLWTTLKTPDVAYDFDSFRVFVWNNRLKRYETAYIQRGVEGYLPLEVSVSSEGVPQFRVNVREKLGVIHRKTFELRGMRVRMLQSVPWPNFDPLRRRPLMERLAALPPGESMRDAFAEELTGSGEAEPKPWWRGVFGSK